MPLEATIAALVRRAAESLGFDVIDVKVDGRRHVRCWIDREPDGVKVQDCADVNRAAKRAIAEDGLESGAFHIEILSPGLDRPLTRPKDYERFVGWTVTVRLAKKRGDRRNWKGKLIGLREGKVVIHEEGAPGEESFVLDEVAETRLVPDLPPRR
jgi:ribosome maturation factor RimP